MLVLRKAAIVQSLNTVLNIAAPAIVSLMTFLSYYYLTGETLQAAQAFAALSLFNCIRFPLQVLPNAVKYLAEASIGCTRITAFLMLPEIAPENLPVVEKDTSNDQLVSMENASFVWNAHQVENKGKTNLPQAGEKEELLSSNAKSNRSLAPQADTLSNISFSVNRGEWYCSRHIGSLCYIVEEFFYLLQRCYNW